MECTLMHKRIPVLDMVIDEAGGAIAKITVTHDERRLPLGINIYKSGIDRGALNDWWTGRSIPASRDGLTDALQTTLYKIGVNSPFDLIGKCYGLSLSDQYWICPKGSRLEWDNVNFFRNDFSADIGEILFGHEPADLAKIWLMSPDNTSDGWLRKKWIIADGKRFLMKGGSGYLQQEPFNEVIASAILWRLGIAHVEYTLTIDGGKPYCLCENFITPDTELIPAWRILQTKKQPNDRSLHNHFLDCCEALGIPDITPALDWMLTLDYIIANEDRHWNNFGLVRNADTLSWLGFAPIYDSGTSLWHDTQRVSSPVKCKPFRSKHEEQIKLVTDLSWFNVGTLNGLQDEIITIFSKSEDVDENRATKIAKTVIERAMQVERMRKPPSILVDLEEGRQIATRTPYNPPDKKHETELT